MFATEFSEEKEHDAGRWCERRDCSRSNACRAFGLVWKKYDGRRVEALRVAVRFGHGLAASMVGRARYDAGNAAEAVEFFKTGARLGHVPAIRWIVVALLDHPDRTVADVEEAYGWLMDTEMREDPWCMEMIGRIAHEEGLFREAAEAWLTGMNFESTPQSIQTFCTERLAKCYRFGRGVRRDVETAKDLYEFALWWGQLTGKQAKALTRSGILAAPDKTTARIANGSKTCGFCKNQSKKSCGGCGEMYYCGLECARRDWTRHERECRGGAAQRFAAYEREERLLFIRKRGES